MELWRKLLENGISNDINLVLIKYSKELKDLANECYSRGGCTGNMEVHMDKYHHFLDI